MLRRTLIAAFALCAGLSINAYAAQAEPRVEVETSLGKIVLQLSPDRAPITVRNFLRYVDEGYYTNTIFHRVISGFMIQGGGFTAEMKEKPTHDPIVLEARGGLPNDRYTVAMARTNYPHSATSQFYINVANNDFLNADKARDGQGYCVFGRVVKGEDVVDKIARVRTGNRGRMSDVPVDPVVILKVSRVK